GRVHRARRDKFRQINRFLEFVADVVPDLPPTGRLDIVDFGCGLSYLTFALHHWLTDVCQRDVRIVGIDQNPQVIARCTSTCRKLGLEGLEFVSQPIAGLPPQSRIHLAVALHACDTATDDALARAVQHQADVILAVPCCQHELAPRLTGEALSLLTEHGILRERFAAMATDALRAAVLELAGYRAQVIEFIDTEHTPKNLLIRAVRRKTGSPDPRLPERIAQFKSLLGIDQSRLEDLLDQLLPKRDDAAPSP
ncbi:MAG: SAM-dependent methyltransferase, partial [Planctomycetaceae bacterium]|nr:SAM-dependent methyltransferase [Planctomycetaceae bacterium]